MWMEGLLGFRGCEGRVGAEVIEVERRRVGGEEQGLRRLGVEDRGRVN